MKIYQDSKELPLFNYERILETKDYFYMIKGYDGSSPPLSENLPTLEQLEEKFNEIVKHFAISINAKNIDIYNYGKAQKCYIELTRLEILHNIIVLKIKENDLRVKIGLSIDNSIIQEVLKGIKIQKSEDLNQQLNIISNKIAKYQNDMAIILANIEKESINEEEGPNINQIITNVELILERTIDMEKITLYRFGLMQEQAMKKVEQIIKTNEKYAR